MEFGIILIQLLIIFLVGVIVIVLGFLLIPFSYSLFALKDETAYGEIKIKWLLGGVNLKIFYQEERLQTELLIFGSKKNLDNLNFNKSFRKKEKQKNNKKIKAKRKFTVEDFSKEVFVELLNLIKNIFTEFKPKYVKGYLILGTGNPFYDAMLDGFKSSVVSVFPTITMNIYSDFSREVIEGQLAVRGSIVPLTLLVIVLKFVFKRPIRNLIFKKEDNNVI